MIWVTWVTRCFGSIFKGGSNIFLQVNFSLRVSSFFTCVKVIYVGQFFYVTQHFYVGIEIQDTEVYILNVSLRNKPIVRDIEKFDTMIDENIDNALQPFCQYFLISAAWTILLFSCQAKKKMHAFFISINKKILLERKYDKPLSIHLFKVRWNDHLVNYFPLMYRYGINKNILHLTFSRAEFRSFWSFRSNFNHYRNI